MNEEFTSFWVRGVIRAEMERRGLKYSELAKRLAKIGVDENERNLRNKVARGTFSAAFFVQCLEAIGVETLRLDMVPMYGKFQRNLAELEAEYENAKPDDPGLNGMIKRVEALITSLPNDPPIKEK